MMIRYRNSCIDLLKFVMALLVVAIHVRPFTGNLSFLYVDCIARLANPMFFTITSYYFFEKVIKSEDSVKLLRQYMKRILMLYLVWFIFYLPSTIQYNLDRQIKGRAFFFKLLQQFFLSGPPNSALWFLTALFLAIPLVYLLAKKCPDWLLLSFSLVLYALTVLEIDYHAWIESVTWINIYSQLIRNIFGWFANGLCYGFFFCSLGYILAKQRIRYKEQYFLKRSFFYGFGLIISLVAVIAEGFFIRSHFADASFGAMFSFVCVSYFAMNLCLNWRKKEIKGCRVLQKMSILIFASHYFLLFGLNIILRNQKIYVDSLTVQYFAVLIASIIFSWLVVVLSKYIHGLKYLY